MPPKQSLIVQDVYKEINKALNHNFRLFIVDFHDLRDNFYLFCSETFQENTPKLIAYLFAFPNVNLYS